MKFFFSSTKNIGKVHHHIFDDKCARQESDNTGLADSVCINGLHTGRDFGSINVHGIRPAYPFLERPLL